MKLLVDTLANMLAKVVLVTNRHSGQRETKAVVDALAIRQADLEPATLMAFGNAKALFNALGNMLKEMDAKRLIETLVKVEAEAVVDVLALKKDRPT